MLTSFIGILLNVLSLVTCWKDSETQQIVTVGWLEWFSDTFHKILYVLLMTGIVICAIYNFVRNKFGFRKEVWDETVTNVESYSKVFSFVEPTALRKDTNCLELSDDKLSCDYIESENQLRLRLKNTQDEIQSLRNQLTMTMDNKAELESTLALLDKEKISAELELDMTRVEGVVELQKIKKENLSIQREIQKILEEKEYAEQEVERLDRDVKICRSALVDAEFLEGRLNEAKKEADVLRGHFEELAVEKGKSPEKLAEVMKHLTDLALVNHLPWTPPDMSVECRTE